MRYRDAVAFRQALEQRLRDGAAGDGALLARDRKRVVFERFLSRLLAVAPGSWMLKGGFALDLRLPERARTTRDVDIQWHGEEEELLDALIEAAAHDAGDFFSFAVERAGPPEDLLGGSHRFRVAASLGGRPFETFPLDVGMGRESGMEGEMLFSTGLLEFAGVGPVSVPALPLEQQSAEKLHAYTRAYEGSRRSTRVKDLVDLALISELSSLDAATLRNAVEATFATRDTHPIPPILPAPPGDWRTPFLQLAGAVGLRGDLQSSHRAAAALFDPVLKGDVEQGVWDPTARRWSALRT